MEVFQSQALKVHEKLELAQKNLLTKVEVVQNYYWVVDHYLNNIYIKEREANVARATSEDVFLSTTKDEVDRVSRLSLSEKT
jgi:hypothetical protein